MPAPLPLPQPPSSPAAEATDSGRVKPMPAASTPPLTKPATLAEPQVIVFTEKEYSCQPSDTFEALSKRFYNTEKYAAALRRHNQNHARASYQMGSSGQITPGEKIFIPPADVLDQRYPDAVGKPPLSSAPAAVPASFNATGSPPPRPLAPLSPSAAPPLAPVGSPPSSPPPPPNP
jgi:hypothetical protein